MKQINWMEGRIKEVARVYHEVYGINNITYEIYPNQVDFKCDGFFLASHHYIGGK